MDKDLISQAVDNLELIDIYLHSSSLKRFAEISIDQFPENMGQQNKLAMEAEFFKSKPKKGTKQTSFISAKVFFGCRYVDDNKNLLSEIEACFVATYLQHDDVSEAAIEEFVRFNVIHNVWPFWREYAFRVASEANLPKPQISFYRTPSKPNKEKIEYIENIK